MNRTVQRDYDWALKMQRFAIPIYETIWPKSRIIELDKNLRDELSHTLDVGGADKMIRFADGGLAFLAQRFRRWDARKWDDFTLRKDRLNGYSTELQKGRLALERHGFVAGFYSYGLANETDSGFARLRILRYPELLSAIVEGKIRTQTHSNTNGSSNFIAIPFSLIPRNYFLFESVEDKP